MKMKLQATKNTKTMKALLRTKRHLYGMMNSIVIKNARNPDYWNEKTTNADSILNTHIFETIKHIDNLIKKEIEE